MAKYATVCQYKITVGMAKYATVCQYKMSGAHEQKVEFNRSQISRWKTEGWNKWGKKIQIDETKTE
jgi:hypothetical protein